MSDNEKNASTEDDTEESFSQLPLIKTRVRKSLNELRHPRQKFCARWERDFPWLKADKVDESVGICTVCNKHLVCKKSHLERHQKSYKHQRLQNYESFDAECEPSQTNEPEFMECGKREFGQAEQEFGQAIELDPDYNVDRDPDRKFKRNSASKLKPQEQQSTTNCSILAEGITNKSFKLDRFKLLKRVDRDRNALNEYYLIRKRQHSPLIQPCRDTFDLFFDSVCATVKSLPPKLGAEVKGRISQLIAEFELRAICEREAQEATSLPSTTSENSTMVVGATTTLQQETTPSVTQESAVIDPTTGVPHIVYTFQPKGE
ncbi:PREDICTED: protein suppressor of variegation 3-7-like [Rhagoletis zephyria]|uniref:protein suppressor of variegation 3-7-like n=1 Tax=Rhagoletis zephyria TaxID=28612 RepID=UPI0008119F9B|nr:PREDICTED: protein suppressor of variegation 3-7-like [Rhagoletis zephyria]XP_036323516.1 protein suppressor of variegation 3-7-like [Rhagoletis pomonella]XP_036323517.1 protein suppressor of variegation 3-7-like [Rhagoletis pomonella]